MKGQTPKKQIIKTARNLFSESSYAGVSMSDIAKKLNVTKTALYYHFAGKAEIYQKVLDEVFTDLSSMIKKVAEEKNARKRLRRLIKNYLDFGLKEKNLVKGVMIKMPPADNRITQHITKLKEQIIELIRPTIEEALSNGKTISESNSRLLTFLLTGMMDSLLLEYSFLNKEISPKKMSNQIITLLFPSH